MTNPDVDRSSLPPPPEGLTESVGWDVVPGEPPGTLAWWDGNEFGAVAFWASDHWEYVTDDWAGSDPALGVLPAGVGDPRESGWWQTPDGRWHGPESTPLSRGHYSSLPPPPSFWRRHRRERRAVLLALLVVGIAAFGFRIAHDGKSILVWPDPVGTDMMGVDVYGSPEMYTVPDIGTRWPTIIFLAGPCVIALVVAIARNRGGRRSVTASVVALAFAGVAIVGGVMVLAQANSVSCAADVDEGSLTSHWFATWDTVSCPESIERAALQELDSSGTRAAAVLLTTGLASGAVAVWLLTSPKLTGRRPLPSR
jgi:hypothetical protein